MKTSRRVLMIVLALVIFCTFAIGSRSSDTEETTTASGDPVATTQGANTNNGNSDYTVGTGSVYTWSSEYGSNYYRLSLPITNTGTKTLYVDSATMDIENADGTLAQSVSYVYAYPQVIAPGETTYYFEEGYLDDGLAVGAVYNLAPHPQVEEAVVPCTRYATSEVQFKNDEYYGYSVTGRVENTSSEAVDYTYIVVTCYDAAGNVIDQEYTTISDTIQPGEKVGFEIGNYYSYDITPNDIASYDIYAFPSQYNW